MTDETRVDRRIHALERSLRRLRLTAGAALIAVIALAASGSSFGPKEIKATRIEIVSPRGDARVVLDQDSVSGRVIVYDAAGKVVARLPVKRTPPTPK